MQVLLIEDDKVVAHSIELMLRSQDFSIFATDLGEKGVELAKLHGYDIVVLDLQLPDISGFEVLKALRLAKVNTPVLILSGNGVVDAKVKALSLGADDYMTKPFHKDELLARARAMMRRAQGHTRSILTAGKLVLDLDAQTLEIDGLRVHLTRKEYQVLELLCRRKGVALTKEMLLNNIYGGMDVPEAKIIDVFVCKLRKKLAVASHGEQYIETIWGWGYVVRDPELKAVA